jgi:hypothetical protein
MPRRVDPKKRFLKRHQLDSFIGYCPHGDYIGKFSKETGILRYVGPQYGTVPRSLIKREDIRSVQIEVCEELEGTCSEGVALGFEGYWGVLRYRDGYIVGVYETLEKTSSFWGNLDGMCHGGFGTVVKVRIKEIKKDGKVGAVHE